MAGVRFVRLLKEASYHLVIANPPYQGTGKMESTSYVELHYPLGKADLYAAFLLRGLELAKPGGLSAMLTMRNWMFIKQYSSLRERVFAGSDLRNVGDFAIGAFDDVANDVLSVAATLILNLPPHSGASTSQMPTPVSDISYDRGRTARKRSATLLQEGRYRFRVADLEVVPEWPMVYWWDSGILEQYSRGDLLGDVSPVRTGLCTSDNTRFLRRASELLPVCRKWSFYISGAKGAAWIDSSQDLVKWDKNGLQIKVYNETLYTSFSRVVQNEDYYFKVGIAFSMIGSVFTARAHRRPSIIGKKGSSVFAEDLESTLCWMNSSRAKSILDGLNPGIGYEVGDVNRLITGKIGGFEAIFSLLKGVFDRHSCSSESSIEFVCPGPSSWTHAQQWAQQAVDRPEGAPLPEYIEELVPEPPTDQLSFAIGIALGRFAPVDDQGQPTTSCQMSIRLTGGVNLVDR